MVEYTEYTEAEVLDEPKCAGLWRYYPPQSTYFWPVELAWSLDYKGAAVWRFLLICSQFFLATPIALILNITGLLLYGAFELIRKVAGRLWALIWKLLEKLLLHILSPLGVFLRVLAFIAAVFLAAWLIARFDLWDALMLQFQS